MCLRAFSSSAIYQFFFEVVASFFSRFHVFIAIFTITFCQISLFTEHTHTVAVYTVRFFS